MSSALTSSELLYFTERGSGPPLLLVHGLMVTGEMFEPVIEHGSKLVIIDGANHALIWTDSAELARVTDEFLGA